MSTATSLSVRALLNSAIAKTGLAGRGRAYSGLTPPAKALAVAAAAHSARDAVVLFVVPTDAELETATSDVRFFLSALEALSDAVAERAVLPFPSFQVDPYRGLAPHFHVASARARGLHAAALGAARVVVASAQALTPRLAPPESVLTTSVDLRPGVEIEPHGLAGILVEGGYERQDPVDEHGEFSLRGGILDVFPAGENAPIRIEFVGDTVESIRRFDPGTQRSIETLDQFQIVPVREGGAAGSGGPGAEEGEGPRAAVAPPERPALPASVFDYLRASRAMRVVISEPQDVRTQIDKWSEQVQASFEQRQSDKTPGDRERRPPSMLVLDWDGRSNPCWSAPCASKSWASTMAVARAPRMSRRSRHRSFAVACPTGSPTSSRRASATKRVLFVASTHGRAERTVELLHDYDVRALLASRADERVEGAVLVAEGLLSEASAFPTRRFRSTPNATSSRRSAAGRRPAASDRWRRRFSPTCATSRSATTSSMSITGSGSSSA